MSRRPSKDSTSRRPSKDSAGSKRNSRAASKDAPDILPETSVAADNVFLTAPPVLQRPTEEQSASATNSRRPSKEAPAASASAPVSRASSKGIPGSERGSRIASKDFASASFAAGSSFRGSLRGSFNGSTFIGSNSFPLSTDQFKEAERSFAMQRRGVGQFGNRLSFVEKVDNNTEAAIEYTLGEHGWFSSCGSIGVIDRRNSTKETNTDAHEQNEHEKQYGLPDFEDSGYFIFEPHETPWFDNQVVLKLGFRLAIHKKTSIERLCIIRHKSTVLEGVTKDQILNNLRSLKRLDHVNILRCQEIYEDDSNFFLFYENFPCVTLSSVLSSHAFTQEQMVNLVRECSAAVAFALSSGINHLGWTLAHILLPATCLKDDPMVAKVFGFGILGFSNNVDISDYSCWAPEAVEYLVRYGNTYAAKIEIKQRNDCDLWSLGAIIYSLISRRPPFVGTADRLPKLIQAGNWDFNTAFDEVDPEAKGVVEDLMQKVPSRRVKADMVLHNAWIRRRWRPPGKGHHVFEKLEEFCSAPLPKRLFGRFLVRFLDPEHLRLIAKSFYTMDSQGDGIIDVKDLKQAAKQLDRPSHAMSTIISWAFPDNALSFSLQHFAESMAEDVIDGKALRHSFESLDDDGSEEISADELFDALRQYSNKLTLEQVLEHISQAEGSLGNGQETDKSKDHKLDFNEYTHLFPKRMRRIKHIQERTEAATHYADKLEGLYTNVAPDVSAWIATLESEADIVSKLALESAEKKSGDAVKSLKEHLRKIADMLKHPPGPANKQAHGELFDEVMKRRRKAHKDGKDKDKGRGPAEFFGFDSFMQDQAIHEFWPVLIDKDRQNLKASIHVDSVHDQITIDYFKAHDAGQNVVKKLDEVLEWAKFQLEEYASFVEILVDPEKRMPELVYSGRGLQSHGDDDDEHDGKDFEHTSAGNGPNFVARLFSSCRSN